MPGSGIVQQAFKTALLGAPSNLDDVASIALESQKFKQRFDALLPHDNLSNAALIAGAGAVTVAALAGAYYLISKRIDKVDDERESFLDSIDQNVVSFFVLDVKDKRRDSVKYVAALISELEKNPILHKFSRLLTKTIDKEDKKGKHYNIFSIASLPFGVHFDQPREDGDNVDEAVQAINFFLGGEFFELLKIVKEEVNHSLLLDTKLFFNAQSHIQDLNATRIIATILANIAINLVQGINPNTSLPLTTDESRKLCEEFRSLLLKLKLGISSEVEKIKNNLVQAHKLELFIERLEERINFLQMAYRDKLKNDLNLDDVINGGYSVIQNTTRTIRRLLYNDSRLENTAMFFSKFIDLSIELRKTPDLFKRLIKKLNIQPGFNFSSMHLNKEPSSVLDFIAIYTSQYRNVRQKALARFKRPADKDFVDILQYIDINYVHYIEDLTNSYGFMGRHLQPINPAREYMICFVALMLEAYNVTLLDKKPECLSSNEQAMNFLKASLKEGSYYGFRYILISDESSYLKNYLFRQINLIIAIRHLGLITTLTEINSGYLKQVDFQAFLKFKLEKLKDILAQFVSAKDNLIDFAAQISSEKPTATRLILSEIDQQVPDKYTNLVDLCTNFATDLERAIKQINTPNFKESLNSKEFELIQKMRVYDLETDAEEFYEKLQNSTQMQLLQENIDFQNSVKTDYDNRSDVESVGSNSNIASFQLKVLNAICVISSISLLVGLIFLLLTTYGVNTSPLIASLFSGVQSALMIAGFVSAAAGGVGLATSYFAPRFFNKSSVLIPVEDTAYTNTL